jgi:mannitol/fructose-specific phosphotransferase system IIA component
MTNLVQSAGILLGVTASSREEAVTLCGTTLLDLGVISPEYVPAMWEREQIFSSYVGREVAIPHGTDEARKFVKQAQVVMLRFSNPIDWDGEQVLLCFGIAASGDEHGGILGNIADILLDDASYQKLLDETDVNKILELLNTESE